MVKIIVDFCQNHRGDPVILQEMIHQAKENGAAYGKIQTIFSDDLTFRQEFEDGRVVNGKVVSIKRPYKQEYERLKKLELNYEQQAYFVSECNKWGLKPLTTCFTRGSVRNIANLGMDTIKVASYDCGSLPLIKDLAERFKCLIISTGATFDNEIKMTASYLNHIKKDYAFLHCVTIYPTPLKSIHLNRINFLKKFVSKVGISEHTLVAKDGVKASLAAIYYGVDYVERHFTILKPEETKDGPVSITPAQLKEVVDFSRLNKDDQKVYINENVPEYLIILGSEKRSLTDEEKLNRSYYRGRFSTRKGGTVIYNWEDVTI